MISIYIYKQKVILTIIENFIYNIKGKAHDNYNDELKNINIDRQIQQLKHTNESKKTQYEE
jgi:hypothetical protein